MASVSQWLNGILDKTIDPIAENFIIAAYNFECSAQLIQRNLRENSYNLTLKETQTMLEQIIFMRMALIVPGNLISGSTILHILLTNLIPFH